MLQFEREPLIIVVDQASTCKCVIDTLPFNGSLARVDGNVMNTDQAIRGIPHRCYRSQPAQKRYFFETSKRHFEAAASTHH